MRFRLAAPLLLAAALHVPAAAQQTVTHGPAADVEAVRALVIRSGDAFNAKDPDTIIALYSRDVILTYPGVPDQDYATLDAGYREMTNLPAGVTVTTVPTIEEIIVSGDLAVVRVAWNTTTVQAEPAQRATRQLRDMQVWRREADGWKFFRGVHFRVPPPQPPAGG
ncbi:nuclear transport factor 2 family protein [Longimicrobium sp.]|uniref:nuclear transport factor 2 family protein n=1 Tax=Longimicrobium sp. TaxID=2029185 RepID=UPI003B3A3FEC